MKNISLILFLFLLSVSIFGQKSAEDVEEEWNNHPFRFLIAENRQTITWIDAGFGSPKKSEKPAIDGKVLIGIDANSNISILSTDRTIFHTHKPIINPDRPSGVVSKGKDEIGEYVDITFDCIMYFSDFGKNEELFGPTQVIYRFYTSGVFVFKEISKQNSNNKIQITILTNYIGTFKIEQTQEIMKLIV